MLLKELKELYKNVESYGISLILINVMFIIATKCTNKCEGVIMFADKILQNFEKSHGETLVEEQLVIVNSEPTIGRKIREALSINKSTEDIKPGDLELPGSITGQEALQSVLATISNGGCKFWVDKSQDISTQYPDAIDFQKATDLAVKGVEIVISDYDHDTSLIIRCRKVQDGNGDLVFDIETM